MRTHVTRRLIALAIAGMFAFAACGDPAPPADQSAVDADPELFTTVVGDGWETVTLASATETETASTEPASTGDSGEPSTSPEDAPVRFVDADLGFVWSARTATAPGTNPEAADPADEVLTAIINGAGSGGAVDGGRVITVTVDGSAAAYVARYSYTDADGQAVQTYTQSAQLTGDRVLIVQVSFPAALDSDLGPVVAGLFDALTVTAVP